MRKTLLAALAGSSIATITVATPAMAQNQPAPAAAADEDDDEEAIVVTGTQIRGIAPVGSNVIGISSDQIKTTGVADANQLLGLLPQSNFFNTLPEPGGGVIGAGTARVPLARPNLRNLPVGGAGSGAITLVLMNGNRIVPSGIEQSAVDAGIVPTSLLERFEAILDGASAVYGSDAVGGVINYITRRKYDGAEFSARYGFADDYWQTQFSATVGKTWDTGGISLSYEFAKNTDLLLGDRSYNDPINWINPLSEVTGVAVNVGTSVGGILSAPHINGLGCDVANVQDSGAAGVTAATNTHHVSGAYTGNGTGFANNPIFCAANEFTTQTPSQRRHSVFAVLSQDIGDSIKFDVTGFYTNRIQTQNSGPVRGNIIIRGNNPNYRCDTVLTGGTCLAVPTANSTNRPMRVQFSYGPALGDDFQAVDTLIETWQITPSFTFDLGKDWQIRASGAYGESKTRVTQIATDSIRLNRAISGTDAGVAPFPVMSAASSLNPYDIASTPASVFFGANGFDDPSDGIFYQAFTQGIHKMTDFRLIADGPLVTLPGGDVKLAVGVEYNKTNLTKLSRDSTSGTAHAFNAPVKAGVTAKSVFGELVIPVFGQENGGPGYETLTLSASGRYDDYGHGINTFNPKFAFTYEPFEWITFRGNWGKSFRAPNPADKAGGSSATVRCIGGNGNLAGCGNAIMQVPQFDLDGSTTLLDTDEEQAGVQTAPCYAIPSAAAPASVPAACTPPSGTAIPGGRIGNTQVLVDKAVFIGLFGTDDNLKPETSTSWSLGVDIRPPLVPGLTLSATYWNIVFKNIISLPQPAISLTPLFRFLPQNYTICRQSSESAANGYAYAATNRCTDPTNPQYAVYHQKLMDFAALAQANDGTQVVNDAINNGHDIIYFVSTQTTNLSTAKVSGIDAAVRYRTDVGFGSIDASVTGAWLLTNLLQFAPGTPFDDQLTTGSSRFRMTATLGATVGDFRAQATYRHQDGSVITPVSLGGVARDASQTHTPGSNAIDLAFTYNFSGSDFVTKDLSVQLVINNVLDEGPVASKTATGGRIGTINTLGRLIEFGISKKF